MVYSRHRRHMKHSPRHADNLNAFVAAQNLRLAVGAAIASGDITFGATDIADTKTVTIDGKVYTFQATLTEADGHVKIGATSTLTATNLFHAINKSGGVAGTDYANAVVAHTTVTATNPTAKVVHLVAKAAGAAGNKAITTNDTNTTVPATLTGGVTAAAFNTLVKLEKYTADQIKAAASAAVLP